MGLTQDRVVVVTGASRGAGEGIALALGAMGDTVYVTGRTKQEGDAPLPGTVYSTAEEVSRRGGLGIPVVCDHADDEQVKALFEHVAEEQGRLDILVNNAICLPDALMQKGPFWEKPLSMQEILDVGLRSSYVASYYAAPLLVRNAEGLVVNTSSFGGRCYMHGPAYGAGKAGVDKMAHDMAVDFKPHNVAVVSIWMGLLKSERTKAAMEKELQLGMQEQAQVVFTLLSDLNQNMKNLKAGENLTPEQENERRVVMLARRLQVEQFGDVRLEEISAPVVTEIVEELERTRLERKAASAAKEVAAPAKAEAAKPDAAPAAKPEGEAAAPAQKSENPSADE